MVNASRYVIISCRYARYNLIYIISIIDRYTDMNRQDIMLSIVVDHMNTPRIPIWIVLYDE